MNLRKYAKLLVMFIGFSLLTVSCDKNLLNVNNPDQQTTATFWKTPQQAQEGVNSVYGSMLLDGGYLRMTQTTEDLRSDDSEANSPWILMTNTGDFSLNATSLSVQLIWLAYYQGIFRANQVFAHIPQIKMSTKLRNELLGQTHFLRGFYYFNLLKFYHNVPLVLHVTKNPKQYDVAQAPPDSVWAQIEKDFKAAIPMLPLKWSGADNQGRATKGAAEAYLGKAYLFQKKYKLAAAEFKKVIDSGVYGLMKNYGENFTTAHENNKESIWEIQFSKSVGGTAIGWGGPPQPNWGQTQARSITYAPQGFGWADIQPTHTLLNVFKQDSTVNGKPDPRLRASLFYNYKGDTLYNTTFRKQYGDTSTAVYWKKYEDYNQNNEYTARSGINIRAMRYADVLLMYAECLNDLGHTSQAYQYIDMVRQRAHLPKLETVKPNLDQQQMQTQIAHERYLELCGEGHRFDDIVRWGWLYNNKKLQWLIKRDPEFKGWRPGREYLPIPQSELDVNPKLKQNPGYGS